MIFHRVLSEFLIQTGLTRNESLTGTSSAAEMDGYLRESTAVDSSARSATSGGDALGLDRKKLELNPRIRFNHRGQVALALPLEQSSNSEVSDEENDMLRYQFFVTLDEAPFLDAKHVVFGTIAGATMFNALRIGRTDADDQSGIPTDMTDAPPRIKSVKVDFHPFKDLVVTADKKIPWTDSTKSAVGKGGKNGKQQSTMEKRRKKRKGKRDLNVLSFGDEERDYQDITSTKSGSKGGGSMLSSHDVLASESKFLSSAVDADVDKRSKEKVKKRKDVGDKANNDSSAKEGKASLKTESSSHINMTGAKEISNNLGTMHENGAPKVRNNDDPKITHRSSEEDRDRKKSKVAKPKSISAVEARRAKYLQSGSGSSANKKERLKREGDTMAKLFAFKSKVIETKGSKKSGEGGGAAKKSTADDSLAARMAKRQKQTEDEEELRDREEEAFVARPGYNGQVYEDNNDQGADEGDWMETKFKCKRHVDQDSRTAAVDKIDVDDIGGDGRRMDDYVVLDEKRSGRDGERNGHKKHRGNRDHGRHNGHHRSR